MKKVFLTSIPKCGTHLLLAYLERLGCVRRRCDTGDYRKAVNEYRRLEEQAEVDALRGEIEQWRSRAAAGRARLLEVLRGAPDGVVVAEHCQFEPELHQALRELGYVILFMVRDPRDQVISYCNHVLRDTSHKNHLRFKRQPRQKTYRELLLGAPPEVEGESNVAPVSQLYRFFEGWLEAEGVLTVAFENLVGAKGNSSRLRQLYESDRIAALVEAGSEVQLDECVRAMFDEKHSLFVRGQAGVWRELFDRENKVVFETRCAPAVASYMQVLTRRDSPDWSRFSMDSNNLRRAWRLAERDLADALAARYAERTHVGELERRLEYTWADAEERLKVIRSLEARLAAGTDNAVDPVAAIGKAKQP